MQGLTLEEIWNVDINYVSHCNQNIGQGHQVKVPYRPSQYIEKKHFARFDGCRPYS